MAGVVGVMPNNKLWRCAQCLERFPKSKLLETHARQSNHKAYKCIKDRECRKSFSLRTALIRHEKSHSVQKTQFCQHCRKAFHRRDHCQEHEAICNTSRPEDELSAVDPGMASSLAENFSPTRINTMELPPGHQDQVNAMNASSYQSNSGIVSTRESSNATAEGPTGATRETSANEADGDLGNKVVIQHFACRSLSIGTWRRVGQSTMDLVIFYSPDKACVTYYINNTTAGYKIEYPFAWIKNIWLEHDEMFLIEGASQQHGKLVIELTRPPRFFMDSCGSGGFYECGDFTEDQQATQVMVHHLSGPAKVLNSQLGKLLSLEAFQNREFTPLAHMADFYRRQPHDSVSDAGTSHSNTGTWQTSLFGQWDKAFPDSQGTTLPLPTDSQLRTTYKGRYDSSTGPGKSSEKSALDILADITTMGKNDSPSEQQGHADRNSCIDPGLETSRKSEPELIHGSRLSRSTKLNSTNVNVPYGRTQSPEADLQPPPTPLKGGRSMSWWTMSTPSPVEISKGHDPSDGLGSTAVAGSIESNWMPSIPRTESHAANETRSPGHSPHISPPLMPQHQALPPFTAENNFGINPTINDQSVRQQNGMDIRTGQKAFPTLNQHRTSGGIGRADQMSPPEINIDFAPNSRAETARLGNDERHKSMSACIACRMRKLKCDKGLPCIRCVKHSRDCTYEAARPSQNHRVSREEHDDILELAEPPPPPNASKSRQKHAAAFQCNLCPSRFTRAASLRDHFRTHNDERPFICGVCEKAFAREHDRKRHEALHSGEKNFVCKGTFPEGASWGCGRSFARREALERHRNSQSGLACRKPLGDGEATEMHSQEEKGPINPGVQSSASTEPESNPETHSNPPLDHIWEHVDANNKIHNDNTGPRNVTHETLKSDHLARSQSPNPRLESIINGMSWGGISLNSFIKDDILMAGTSPPNLQSPSFHSSSYLPKMESAYMKDYVCCNIHLASMHELLQHYEEVHAARSNTTAG